MFLLYKEHHKNEAFLLSIDLHKKVYSKKDIMYISVLFLFYAMKSMYIHNMQRIFRFLKIKGCPQNNNVRCSLLCNFSHGLLRATSCNVTSPRISIP